MMMRAVAGVGWLVLVLWAGLAPATAQADSDAPALSAFAQRVGLHDGAGFVATVEALRADRRLPPQYATKTEARAHGWRGGGLCAAWPGHIIGGNRLHNFAGRLPEAPGRVYREADLDETCTSRGAKRLIFSNDGLLYVTPDHYNSFIPVP